VLFAEGGALGAHGYRRELLVGQGLADVLPSASYQRLVPEYRMALTGDARSIVHRAADGAAWYWVQFEPLRNPEGEVEAAVAVSIDITARKLIEQELEQTTRLMQDILDSVAKPISVKDHEGRFLIINEAYERAIGRRREEVAGSTIHDVYPPEFA
jgi:PAS domain S-box-containing protein